MSGNLFRSVGGMKNLGQALRRCSTDCKNSGKLRRISGDRFAVLQLNLSHDTPRI
ncbi:hypothetical protein OROMI_015389 [Orobanche minor]